MRVIYVLVGNSIEKEFDNLIEVYFSHEEAMNRMRDIFVEKCKDPAIKNQEWNGHSCNWFDKRVTYEESNLAVYERMIQ